MEARASVSWSTTVVLIFEKQIVSERLQFLEALEYFFI